MTGEAGQAPDSFDSPDGRTYSAPGGQQATAGQAPEVYRRWCQVNQPANWTAPLDLIEAMWSEKTVSEREFWLSLDGLDLASNEMLPGELDATLATVPPCDEISPWGMRCRMIRAHDTHRDRDGNMWPAPADLAKLTAERDQLRGWLVGIMRGNDAEIGAARAEADEWIREEGLWAATASGAGQ